MDPEKYIKIRYYREVPDDMQIPDVVLPALATAEIILATTQQLQSYEGDETKPRRAEIVTETGQVLAKISGKKNNRVSD